VCGILIEVGAQTGPQVSAVAGIGLNVQQSADDFIRAGLPLATSLRQHCDEPLDTDEVARRLLAQLDEEYDRLCRGDLATLQACWSRHLGLLGKDVVAECTTQRQGGRLMEVGFECVVLDRPGLPPLILAPELILHLDVSPADDQP
jgi:BirA family biotin operon repressor/biotin-[acetyl-CoA-carboxylase] ligase